MKLLFPTKPSQRGAAMIAALMIVMASTIALTGFMYLMTARLRQVEALGAASQRHITWGNSLAINQQYAHTQALRDGVTRPSSTVTFTGTSNNVTTSNIKWGGVTADVLSAMSAFRAGQRPGFASAAYPYNNVQPVYTPDSAVYFTRSLATTDSTQDQTCAFYNYLKTYPSSLLGDLLVLHKAADASITYSISRNISVNGRVVVWDSTATSTGLRANSFLARYGTGAGSLVMNDTTGTAILPDNWPDSVTCTAGNGSGANAPAVTDGTLNMCSNSNFTPGSLLDIATTAGVTTISGLGNSGTATSQTQTLVDSKNSPVYGLPPTAYDYRSAIGGQLNVCIVRLTAATASNVSITGNFEQLVIEGELNSADYTASDAGVGVSAPIIIYINDPKLCDIRFIGENNRRVILALGPATNNAISSVYVGFQGPYTLSGAAIHWRLHLVNEYKALNFDPPSGYNMQIYGGIRTNRPLLCTETTTTPRIFLNAESTPGPLETLLPRDSYFNPIMLVQ